MGSFSIDSRSLKQGDWFFCIRGERTDGHQYISDALERGAAGVVLDPSRIPEELCEEMIDSEPVSVDEGKGMFDAMRAMIE